MREEILIIMGLGNPGKQYVNTRHNIGFRVLEVLQKHHRFSSWRISEKYYSFISEGKILGKKIMLVKPYTFMNNSGRAAKKFTSSLSSPLPDNNLWVVHDDLALPLGSIRIAKDRGAGGHKGVHSIIQALGTKKFVRFRIGIAPRIKRGSKKASDSQTFVLQNFTPQEQKILKKIMQKTTEAMLLALQKGLARAMTEYNK